eukprot:scaffold5586_cov124-Isochrysis_galbana.AAC.21
MYLTRTDRRYSSDVLLPAAAAARSSRSAASSLASVTANLRCSSNHASRVADLASPTGASRPEGEAASTPRGSASHPSAIDAMSRTGKGVAGGRRATASEAGCCLAEGFASPREGVDTPRGALQCRATEAADGARGVRKAHTPEARLFPVPAARSARSLCSLPSSSALKWRRIARTCNKAPLSSSPISMNLISVFLRKPSSSAPPTRSASAAARACSSSCRDRSIRRSASALAARSWAKAARSRSRLACSAACCRRSRAIVSSTPSSRERVTRVARTASRPSPAPAGCRLEWSPALAPSAGAVSAAAVPSLLRTPGPPAATAAADPSLEAPRAPWPWCRAEVPRLSSPRLPAAVRGLRHVPRGGLPPLLAPPPPPPLVLPPPRHQQPPLRPHASPPPSLGAGPPREVRPEADPRCWKSDEQPPQAPRSRAGPASCALAARRAAHAHSHWPGHLARRCTAGRGRGDRTAPAAGLVRLFVQPTGARSAPL